MVVPMNRCAKSLGSILAVCSLVLGGCGSDGGGSPAPETQAGRTVTGGVTKTFPLSERRSVMGGDPRVANGASCSDGPASVSKPPGPGSQVVVKNQKAETIGTGTLEDGQWDDAGCTFPFTVRNLPAASFYEISVTGVLPSKTISESDLERQGWRVQLSVPP